MSNPANEPIAIVGSACHFAGNVSSPSTLWDLLSDPKDVRQEIPNSRFNTDSFYHRRHDQPGHSSVKHSYLLDEDVSAFDAEFFNIKPVEAKAIDPQQRWLLETVYEGLEAAGLPVEKLRGSDTSVYVGVMCSDYESINLRDLQAIPTYLATGTSRSILANRISYVFDWHGPSVTVETACSSSLVGLHMAVQTLRTGDSKVAVVCGSNLILGPENYVVESQLNMLSPDGVCRMWDQDANGYARGDGVAALVLKTLSRAIADGDHIECIIRETGVNQDGATPGITVPSVSAQRALIRHTYAKAGLDPLNKPEDRPQYFEAHGTGTPAGDPIEAEAIYRAFFADENHENEHQTTSHPLLVGSIKTVLGHTEATAGLAGILKASLALQHSSIPPNLQFRNLSHRVAPFYHNIEIVHDAAKAWPVLRDAAQWHRRASVNSFGFGGTNAHAILENFVDSQRVAAGGVLYTPFVFSASSEYSLRASLSAYKDFLNLNPTLNPHDLAWTLRSRRSVLAHRACFAASSIHELKDQLNAASQDKNNTSIGVRVSGNFSSDHVPNRLLGVFTGQGAQFARLGAELLEQSIAARRILKGLEAHLAALPEEDRPSWSLSDELLASSDSSRINEATISQPLCTAIQILLVDLLALAGVRFDAVVGHSSGEIGAAYAAGILSARDALLIAYFRGVYAERAASPNGDQIRGAMLAVETSLEDAEELCRDALFAGRLGIAAYNSPTGVTFSGDEDAIDELQDLLEDENKFHRRLRVDKAYHSRHMTPCCEPYVESLRRNGVKALKPLRQSGSQQCQWFSSVYNRVIDPEKDDELSDTYWIENMTRPVLFTQALETALLSAKPTQFDLIVEVGPHPALQGPAAATIQKALGKNIPYHGTLSRKASAVTAMSSCLGFLWQYSRRSSFTNLDLDNYERAMSTSDDTQQLIQTTGEPNFKLIEGLPPYRWNHTTKHWAESRISRRMRLHQGPFHLLLGHATPDSSPHHLRWRNILSAAMAGKEDDDENDELAWMAGHSVQDQTVFPAAGYVTTAVEAARALSSTPAGISIVAALKKKVGEAKYLIEIRDLEIRQAIALKSNSSEDGIEVLIELADIAPIPSRNSIRARFTYSAGLGNNDDSLTLTASANVEVVFTGNKLGAEQLPIRPPIAPHMIDVDSDRFYTSLAKLGYNYAGKYRSMKELKRKHGRSSCQIKSNNRRGENDGSTSLLVHPADLDAAFQSVLLAYSYPGDGQLGTLYFPLRIESVRVDPTVCTRDANTTSECDSLSSIDAVLHLPNARKKIRTSVPVPRGGFVGDVSIFPNAASNAAIQVQGLQVVPFRDRPGEDKDRKIFTKMHWVDTTPDGLAAAARDHELVMSLEKRATLTALKRLARFYLRQFDAQVPISSPQRSFSESGHNAYYLEYAHQVATSLTDEELRDTEEDVQKAVETIKEMPDARVIHLVGQTMPRVFRGETTMLEALRQTGVLDEYYLNSFANAPSGHWQANIISQIANRNPHLNMLEVGAGTGGTTKPILRLLGNRFKSYTFTDVSAGFFGSAAETLSTYKDRLIFKTLDVESDPTIQGFCPGGYDVIIASFVLHATASLSRTLAHVRSLLRPGGYLIVGEGTVDNTVSSFIFGPLTGWWLGRGDEGRTMTPHVSTEQWDRLLRKAGFSGIDATPPATWEDALNVSLFMSQAVDNQISFLREPLTSSVPPPMPMIQLVIVGGQTPQVAGLVKDIRRLLEPFFSRVHHFPSLVDVDYDGVLGDETRQPAVLSLTDLDKPVFQDITETEFVAFQRMFQTGKALLWVTSGRRHDEPYSNMVVGFGRTAVHEIKGLCLQHLDIRDPAKDDTARKIAETLLRLGSRPIPVEEEPDDSILWTVEPEIVVDEDGRYRVARLQPLREPNDRYNSGRRTITREVNVTERAVAIQRDDKDNITIERLPPTVTNRSEDSSSLEGTRIKLYTSYATLSALWTPLGHKFLVQGVDATGAKYLALAPSLTSIINLSVKSTIPLPDTGHSGAKALSSVAAHLIATTIIDSLFQGQTILVHNAAESIAHGITSHAAEKGVTVVFVADEYIPQHTTDITGASPLILPPYLTRAELWELLPSMAETSSFISFTPDGQHSETRGAIIAALPPRCRKGTPESLFSSIGYDSNLTSDGVLTKLLNEAVSYAQRESDTYVHEPNIISLGDLVEREATANEASIENSEEKKQFDALAVVALTVPAPLPARITRLDAGRTMFKANKTYWMVGLTGALGVSLCDWMIGAGARHIVLSSRSPQIESAWVESHRRSGIDVTVIPCDITNYDNLAAVHASLRTTHPPIAGVLNGAMVLRDTSVHTMTYTHLVEVVRPKVLGSLNLDRLFSSDKPPLDFFILFSSINCIIGNQGQANYAAANAFQCALAAARRRRGLPGVAVNIGAIIGAGYIQRSSTRILDLTVTRGAMMHLSEEDFHQLIAEGIAAGYPSEGDEDVGDDDDRTPELTTGLLEVPYDTAERPFWFTDPKFAHLIVEKSQNAGKELGLTSSNGGNVDGNATSAPLSVKEQLQSCQTKQDAERIVGQSFAAQLRSQLQMTIDDEELMGMRSNEIGLDSLVSVDIRSWFIKTIAVSIPVLRIMSNDTMTNLVQHAVELLPQEALPQASVSNETNDAAQDESTSTSPTDPSANSTLESSTSALTTSDTSPVLIDWDAETAPPDTPDDDNYSKVLSDLTQSQTAIHPPQTIVLTGVTGFLGRHILQHVLQTTPTITKIICIAVRHLPEQPADPNADSNRITYFTGDLTLPRLGLSLSDSVSIFSTADAVIHAGASTSHLSTYASLRAANVGATSELARLCVPRKIPIHFISSAGVGLIPGSEPALRPARAPGTPLAAVNEAGERAGDVLTHGGYIVSKWACERLLERTNEAYGLPVTIYRPSTIIREGRDAEGGRASLDWMTGLARYVHVLKALPEIRYVKGVLDMVYTRSVCEDIIRGVAREEAGVLYVHSVGDIVVPLDRMQDLLKLDPKAFAGEQTSANLNEVGQGGVADDSCEVLPMAEWTARAIAKGLHPAVAALIEEMDGPGKPSFPKLLKSSTVE
ncbi:putative polyketide synthase [Hypoxylon trugodes]|uniref:putative polyketide synthase n=1 Tax=Hypoxylon trugodes TaxID=326681 RepID=UPI00219C08AB|nr:putative polyketide synthase [Hypoxylon trugodes]KAI1392107.1 putative polyketide synthase [Hypoxylon trugodes]